MSYEGNRGEPTIRDVRQAHAPGLAREECLRDNFEYRIGVLLDNASYNLGWLSKGHNTQDVLLLWQSCFPHRDGCGMRI